VAAPPELLAFMIELSIDERPALVLALSKDGAVNRGGSGKAYPVEKDVFIQQTDGSFFRDVVTLFDPSWLDRPGVYVLPGRIGPRHLLKLSFACLGRPPIVLAFDYRQDSAPPPAVQAFVQRALEVTQRWYDQQRGHAARYDASTQKKPWWKVW
jgi:hypothetical protein